MLKNRLISFAFLTSFPFALLQTFKEKTYLVETVDPVAASDYVDVENEEQSPGEDYGLLSKVFRRRKTGSRKKKKSGSKKVSKESWLGSNGLIASYFSMKLFRPDYVNKSELSFLDKPKHLGLPNAKFFSIEGKSGKLGAWLIEPAKEYAGTTFIYVHGIYASRAYAHRVEMYKVLSRMGFRIITFDYRGFADSTPVSPINEYTTTDDTRLVVDWAKANLGPRENVVVWGHSMGTGISASTVSRKNADGYIRGLVLESPYTTLSDSVVSTFHKKMEKMLVKFVIDSLDGFSFNSIENLKKITIPVMILHAEDDETIDVKMGKRLFQSARKAGVNVVFHLFPAGLGHGHNNIYRDKYLPNLIHRFLNSVYNSRVSYSRSRLPDFKQFVL